MSDILNRFRTKTKEIFGEDAREIYLGNNKGVWFRVLTDHGYKTMQVYKLKFAVEVIGLDKSYYETSRTFINIKFDVADEDVEDAILNCISS